MQGVQGTIEREFYSESTFLSSLTRKRSIFHMLLAKKQTKKLPGHIKSIGTGVRWRVRSDVIEKTR